MIPMTSLQHFLVIQRDLFIYTRHHVLLPTFVYGIILCHIGLQSSIAACLGLKSSVWTETNPFSRLLRLITVIAKLGFVHHKYEEVIVEESVSYILFVLFLIPTILGSYMFRKVGRLSPILLYLICIVHDVLFPLLTSTFSTSVGFFIGIAVMGDNSIPLVFCIIMSIIKIILWYLYVFYANNLIYPQLTFYKGRTFTWTGSTINIIRMCVDLILLLSAMAESTRGAISQIFSVLCFAVSTICAVVCYVLYPYFNEFFNIYHASLQITGSIVSFLVVLIEYNIHIPLSIPIVVMTFGLTIIFLVLDYVEQKRKRGYNTILKALANKEVKIQDLYTNPLKFLRLVRHGFIIGDRYVLSWKPFKKGVKLWPNHYMVWNIYLRCAAVYVEQNTMLMEIYTKLKERKKITFYTKSLLKQIKMLNNSRTHYMSKEMKQQFKTVTEKNRMTKSLLVSYWNSIIDNSPSSAYNTAKQLQVDLTNRDSDFNHLINVCPNNPVIANKYAQFLKNVICDPAESEFWEKRAAILKKTKEILIDFNRECALKAFPLIPREYNFEDHNHDVLVLSNTTATGSLSSTGNESALDIDNYTVDSGPSRIRHLGLEAPIGFVQINYYIVTLFFIFAYVLSPFLPSFIMLRGVEEIKYHTVPVELTSRIFSTLSMLNVLFLHEGLRNGGIIAPFSVEIQLLDPTDSGSSHLVILENYLNDINSLTDQIHTYFAQYLDSDSKAVQTQVNHQLTLITPNNDIESSILEGLNMLVGESMKYQPNTSFLNESWINNFQDNYLPVSNSLLNIADILWDELPNLINDYVLYALISAVVAFIISFLIFLVFVVFVLRIPYKWEYIINVINSVPRVSIQNFLTKQTKKQNEELNHSEKKYSNIFNQIISSRDRSNGLPIASLLGIGVVNVFCSGVFAFLIIYVVTSESPQLGYLTNKKYYAARLNYFMFNMGYGILLAQFLGNPTSGNKVMEKYSDPMFNSLDNFTFLNFWKTEDDINMETFLFSETDGWENYENVYKRLRMYPRSMILEVVTNSINYAYDKQFLNASYDPRILFIFHLLIDKTYPLIIQPCLFETNEFLFQKLLTMIFLISGLLLVIGIFLIIVLIVKLKSVEKTVKFCLSSLSMLKPQYIRDSKNIMQLLIGNFKTEIIHNHSLDAPLQMVSDISPDCIITLDKISRIVYFNESTEKIFGLDIDDWKKVHISLLFSIEEEKAMENITKIAETQELQNYASDGPVFIRLFSSELRVKLLVNSYRINHSAEETCIIILKDISNVIALMETLQQLKEHNEKVIYSIIPKRIRNKYDIHNQMLKTIAHNVFLCGFEFVGFSELYKQTSSNEIFKSIKSFQTSLENQTYKANDAILIKNIGCTSIVVFNYLHQSTNSYENVSGILRFIKEFHKSCPEKHQFKVSFTMDKNIVLSFRSANSIQFNAGSKQFKEVFNLLHSAKVGSILLPNDMFDFVPIEWSNNATQEQYMHNNVAKWAKSIKISTIY